jgi:hypothetical protein
MAYCLLTHPLLDYPRITTPNIFDRQLNITTMADNEPKIEDDAVTAEADGNDEVRNHSKPALQPLIIFA